jgi:leucyl aminopeptidase
MLALIPLASAVSIALPAPPPGFNCSTAPDCRAQLKAAGWRLIKRSPDGDAQWINATGVNHLVYTSECGGADHHPKPGFVDVTNVRHVHNHTSKLRRDVVFPTHPQRLEQVREMIGNHLVPGGELRGIEFLTPLTEFNNRYYTGPEAVDGSVFVARWAEKQIEASGRTDAFVSLLTNPDFPQMNIVARIAGSNPGAAPLVMGGHFDSINSVGPEEAWATARAPGADDDGSGSTAVMLAFEAVLNSGLVPVRPIEFHWYAGEERGLLGSRVMADKYEQMGRLPFAQLNLDMCGGPLGQASFRFIGDFVSTSLTQFEQALVDEYCENDWEDGECGYACSDHASWHEVGVPSSFPIEAVGAKDPVTGEDCPGHTAEDKLVCVDFANVVDYAKLAVAYVVELHDFFE